MASPVASIVATRLIVGMEVHVELATRSKMFTRAPNPAHPEFENAAPNTLVDPLVAALPGALPAMNRAAIELSIRVGLALNCSIAKRTVWDRKNYFYPDLPKGYQISQYDHPLCSDGYLDIPTPGGTHRIGIIRAHLEEDAGKLGHELPGGASYEGSLVDLNRAGTPLLEVVTAPDLTSADDAELFARELRLICLHLGVTQGVMQRGHMRFEPNINLELTLANGTAVRTPIVEIKNLNSFRALRGAIEHEATRQVTAWQADGIEMGPGAKSTRGWNDAAGETVRQRDKEDAHDYRYFPDPDLLPVEIDPDWPTQIAGTIGELPIARRARYQAAGLSPADARALTDSPSLTLFFEACHARVAEDSDPDDAARNVARWLLNAGSRVANDRGVSVEAIGITPDQLAGLIALRRANEVGSSAADSLFEILCASNEDDVRAVAEREGLLQVSDDAALTEWIDAAIAEHPDAAADFAHGKDAAIGRLIGAVMAGSGGRADAAAVRSALIARLR